MTRILGIDPGIHGGLAIVETNNGMAPQLIDAIDITVTGVGAKERVDAIALHEWITAHCPQHAFVERAQSMSRQGSSSGFKYGRAVGSIEAVIACCEIPMTIVEPTAWKTAARQRQKDQLAACVATLSRGACSRGKKITEEQKPR